MAITPVLVELAWRYPRLTVEVHCDDAVSDLLAESFDAAIGLVEVVQRDMAAVRLMQPFKLILVAAPEYLDVNGTPKEIGDLHGHNCIGLRFGSAGGIFDWELKDGRKTVAVKISGTALVTDPAHAHALELALAGVGITRDVA
jgi:DNA-binding transcriptional LysR family regulator